MVKWGYRCSTLLLLLSGNYVEYSSDTLQLILINLIFHRIMVKVMLMSCVVNILCRLLIRKFIKIYSVWDVYIRKVSRILKVAVLIETRSQN